MANKILSRDDFLSGSSLRVEEIPVPELGGSVFLRELTTPQLLAIKNKAQEFGFKQDETSSDEVTIKLMALVLSQSACDADGHPIFTIEDLEELIVKNKVGTLLRLGTKALEISGLDTALSGVSANLKKVVTTSSSSNSRKSSTKRRRRS